jgi:hypothetical protein
MTTSTFRDHVPIAGVVILSMLGVAGPAAGQSESPIKVGIFPFADATASGNRSVGSDVGRTMMSEFTHSTALIARLLVPDGAMNAEDLDGERAVAIGREQHLDLVFVGTVLEAKTEDSSKRGWLPSIKGQSANIDIRRVKARVVLQGDLYDVATGARLFSERVTGNDSNNEFGGTANTTFGSWGKDNYRAFLDSPLGKALQLALADLTRKVAAASPSRHGRLHD